MRLYKMSNVYVASNGIVASMVVVELILPDIKFTKIETNSLVNNGYAIIGIHLLVTDIDYKANETNTIFNSLYKIAISKIRELKLKELI